MKLLLILPLIAACYAAKLDRTYLPPANAGSAGGSPGSLTAPNNDFPTPISSLLPKSSDTFSATPNGRPGFSQTPGSSTVLNGAGNPISQDNNGIGNTDNLIARFPGQASAQNFAANSGINRPIGSIQVSDNMQNRNLIQQTYAQERPQASADVNAEILRYSNENDGETFSYSFETSNGISAEESGVATNGVQAKGAFSYTGDDGHGYSITYTADENGYLPQGEHLPTPHPIPEEILKSIEINEKAAAAGIQEGAYRPEEYGNDNIPQQYNQAQSQDANSPQSQASYTFAKPSASNPNQQRFPSPIGSSAINPFRQQTTSQEPSPAIGYKTQQGSFPFGNDSPNQNSQVTGNLQNQIQKNQNLNGYNYQRPQYSPINANSVVQKSVEAIQPRPIQQQGNIPSTYNTQTVKNQIPSFNDGSSTNAKTSPFSQLNGNAQSLVSSGPTDSLNKLNQNSYPFGQSGRNNGLNGYNYDKPQPTQYRAPTNTFIQGTLVGDTPQQAIRGQSNLQARPESQAFSGKPSLNNGATRNSGSALFSPVNKYEQSFASNPIEATNKAIQTNIQFAQRGSNKESDGYNYDKPQFNQFSSTLNNQGIFSNNQPQGQNQDSIPSKTSFQTFDNQKPSFHTGTPLNSGYQSNKNDQLFGFNRPSTIPSQIGSAKAPISQTGQDKNSNGYNYDAPQFNQNVFSQVGPSSQNQGIFPSRVDSTINVASSPGSVPATFLNENKPSVESNRPINIPVPATKYVPQAEYTRPINLNQASPRDSIPSQAPYQYDRPASPSSTSSQLPSFVPLGSSSIGNQNQRPLIKEEFGGPRQPPSFSAEQGYTY